MLDQLHRDIKNRLDDLLGEADKLRRALAALGSRNGDETPSTAPASAKQSAPSRGRPRSTAAPRGTAAKPTGSRSRATVTATRSASASPKPAATPKARAATRTAPGATKNAILAALTDGGAMTAGEIATATGLGRPTVSTTLSRLAKTGEVSKASRGYELANRGSVRPTAS
jgi:DNA-binding transcriptional ArsR family regulator